jgi:stress response protein SCP2
MSEIQGSNFRVISPAGETVARCDFSGHTFSTEKAVMVTELYRKSGEWRLASNLQGYAEGLDALVRHFGGEVAEEVAQHQRLPRSLWRSVLGMLRRS